MPTPVALGLTKKKVDLRETALIISYPNPGLLRLEVRLSHPVIGSHIVVLISDRKGDLYGGYPLTKSQHDRLSESDDLATEVMVSQYPGVS
jgi:hypothetical protein